MREPAVTGMNCHAELFVMEDQTDIAGCRRIRLDEPCERMALLTRTAHLDPIRPMPPRQRPNTRDPPTPTATVQCMF
ncbi:hypothetical protein HED54_14890 [Ochrobactrum anthropi ATCC 49188]|nr:hypothetical protein [Brucella anthropi ATCC 49188]